MEETAVKAGSHQRTLDGLRGLAILLVMGHHLFVVQVASQVESVAARVASLGAFGVDLFFVLSGFLITGILLDGKGGDWQLVNFYARRTLRIFPLYYLVLAVCFLALPAAMQLVPAAAPKLSRFQGATDDWPWYLLYLSNYAIASAGEWRHGVLDVTWSLAIEEQFYLIWPWVVRWTSRQTLGRVCWGVIVLALVCRLGVWAGGYSWLAAYVLTPCRADALAVGGLIAVTVRGEGFTPDRLRRAAAVGLAVALPALVAVAAAGFFKYDQPWVFTGGYTVVATIAGCVLLAAALAAPGTLAERAFSHPVLVWFGKYSYALYLFHLPVRAAIRDLAFGDAQFRTLPGGPWTGQLLFYLITTMAVTPLAWFSWRLVENPILRLKRYFPYKRR